MTILDKIIVDKKKEVELKRGKKNIDQLIKEPLFERSTYSLKTSLNNSQFGFISEFKRQSPSKGVINSKVEVEEVVTGYQKAGTLAVSVLTDEPYFKGTLEDLVRARSVLSIPILRKDFMISEYQLYEAKAYGADIILLIAAVLNKNEVKELSSKAKDLGLEVLLELHEEKELETICDEVDFVGINNRNLKTFEVDIQNSINMGKKIPSNFLKISESGLSDPAVVTKFISHGFKGFLVGETFMKSSNPGETCFNFINAVNKEVSISHDQ